MIKNIALAICVLLFPFLTHASLILAIDGKVKSFDEKTVSVENDSFIYQIKKEALTPDQQNYVRGLKSGASIHLSVDRSAVAQVSDRKK